MIETIDLTKRYEDGTLALDHVTISVPAGSIYCLFGPRGAGKSTLVNILLNLLPPTGGCARVGGLDCTKACAGAQRLLGFVPERISFYGDLSGVQHLKFFAHLSGHDRMTPACLRMALREVRLPERAFDMRVGDYTGTMRQQLALAIARTKHAPALLLDEPIADLDPGGSMTFLSLIHDMKREGMAILVVTHDTRWPLMVADRVGFLRRGVLVRELSAEEFPEVYLHDPSFEEVCGIGVSTQSTSPGRLRHRHL